MNFDPKHNTNLITEQKLTKITEYLESYRLSKVLQLIQKDIMFIKQLTSQNFAWTEWNLHECD